MQMFSHLGGSSYRVSHDNLDYMKLLYTKMYVSSTGCMDLLSNILSGRAIESYLKMYTKVLIPLYSKSGSWSGRKNGTF